MKIFLKCVVPTLGLLSFFAAVLSSNQILAESEPIGNLAVTDEPKPFQRVSTNAPPLSPERFNPDLAPLNLPPRAQEEVEIRRILAPNRISFAPFNPDPGTNRPLQRTIPNSGLGADEEPSAAEEPRPEPPKLPETVISLQAVSSGSAQNGYGSERVPEALKLPRQKTRVNPALDHAFENPEYERERKTEGKRAAIWEKIGINAWLFEKPEGERT